MYDLHSHILPGVDDGATTVDESVGIARAAVGDGIHVLAATPHVRDDYPTSPDSMEEALGVVRAALVSAQIPLDVVPGGEIALECLPVLDHQELRRFGLAGNSEYLLLEFPYTGWPLSLARDLDRLRRLGIRAVLAHPERNREVQADLERLRPFVDAGGLVQVTAASLEGRLGRRTLRTTRDLVDQGLAHMLASDAHMPEVRTVGLSGAVRALGDDDLSHWLTSGMPGAIVQGTELPPRPERGRRTSFFRRS